MLCSNCAKLASQQTNKSCRRCQGGVFMNIAVICDKCSAESNQCIVCLKKIVTAGQRASKRGCNCGK